VTGEPLVAGPVYGLRTWRVVSEPGGERLAAPHRGTAWPLGGEWLRAACPSAGHAAPAPGCDCGVHGLHPRRGTARQVLACRREIAGVVEAEGAVELYEDGFRAERGRPYALFSLPGRNAAQIARLAETYGARVADVRTPDELVAWCREHELGLSEPVVAELLGPVRSGPARRRRATDALRVAAALAIAALLVALGLALAGDPPGERTLYGRTGEVRTP
jgi:hypothetical protein